VLAQMQVQAQARMQVRALARMQVRARARMQVPALVRMQVRALARIQVRALAQAQAQVLALAQVLARARARARDTHFIREFFKIYAVLTSGFLQVQEFFCAEVKRLHDHRFCLSLLQKTANQRGTPETTSRRIGERVKRAQARPFSS
jgi:hypothetical protein